MQPVPFDQTDTDYCEYCQIVPITPGDKYCLSCLNDIIDYLAVIWTEQVSAEKGLY